ncbi:MAG TPA: SDR family oxidoreductase [Candidatus Hydrogenedentes bacterium]|nr:SDR family oxidoreductase [Candidatus Hydrogenedentota bacterium]HNT87614.1 SDR family oxidoreductase [Candidatus Hydrogenedentota bacterium]
MNAYNDTARIVVVTGASTGIGKACALELAARGFRVYAGVRRTEDGEALRTEAPERITPIMLDVTRDEDVQAAARAIEAACGERGLYGLVNNAGIAVAGPLEFLPAFHLRRQFEVNVIGVMAVTQAFLPLLRRGCGRIVNIGSVSGRLAMPLLGPYAASKAAIAFLSDALRAELRSAGVEVALIEPGVIRTPIWQKSGREGTALRAMLPKECEAAYGKALDRIEERVAVLERMGAPPEAVARKAAHAMLARRPRTRYLVGRGARLQIWLGKLLPDRLRDWFFAKALGL